jgi:hypothetical protein
VTSLRTPFSANDQNICEAENKGPEVTFFFIPTQDTVPLEQDKSQQEISQWKNHPLSGLLRCTIFLFHNWSSFTKIISSFPSLQDIKTVLNNAFN